MLALSVSPADAVVPAGRAIPFAGTSTFNFTFADPVPCSLIHQTFDATLGKGGQVGSFHLDGCTDLEDPLSGTGPATYDDATFTLTDRQGATTRGTVTGFIDDQPTPPNACTSSQIAGSFELTLQPASAPGTTRHPLRTYSLVGVWCSLGQQNVSSPITGTLTVHQ
jgi:hypothetical protein